MRRIDELIRELGFAVKAENHVKKEWIKHILHLESYIRQMRGNIR